MAQGQILVVPSAANPLTGQPEGGAAVDVTALRGEDGSALPGPAADLLPSQEEGQAVVQGQASLGSEDI